MNFAPFIAWRYLRTPKKEGFVAVVSMFSFLGMTLGVATLIIVMSVMNGFKHELETRILGFNSHLTLFATQPVSLKDIKDIPHVHSINPFMDKQGICASRQSSTGAIIRCMPFDDLKKKKMVSDNIVMGTIGQDSDQSIVIGHKLAEKLSVRCNDVVRITAAEGRPSPLGMLPRTRDFKISGIFNSGMHEYDSTMIFLPLSVGRAFFDPTPYTAYEIFLDRMDHTHTVKNALLKKKLRVIDWKKINSSMFKAIQVQSNVMFLILTLIVLVAAFNIMSGLVMLVKDKTKDIAILKTMGATQTSIMCIFMMIGSFIGIVGTMLGSGLGLAFAYNIDRIRLFLESISDTNLFQAEIYFLSSLPSRVDTQQTLGVIAIALALTIVSTAYPAWKGARLNPAKGLHYD